ncbi:type I-E CRISPR-associated protein Cse1/CasA, partial [Lactobacillus salivarius]
MSKMKFNLVEDPWIKVLDKKTTEIKKLTLIEVFTNTSRYSRLSGEMSSQDLAVMRFLLAILTTVYLRFDMDGNAYPWLDKKENFFVEPNKEFEKLRGNKWKKDILLTWKKLYDQGQFSDVVVQYLKENKELFDIFGSNPFYQVTKEE